MTRRVIVSLINGEDRWTANGEALEDSIVSYSDFDDETVAWLDVYGYGWEHPGRWVLITPAEEDPAAVNVIAQREIAVGE
ncbi:hypothetical protein [Nonomuraea sp. NPDC049784]|uniref:hypothetical protein n=1 Tax=Nonomuraea sp. NPDC049784 TaxID=3154361 RepID=UPI0033E4B416